MEWDVPDTEHTEHTEHLKSKKLKPSSSQTLYTSKKESDLPMSFIFALFSSIKLSSLS